MGKHLNIIRSSINAFFHSYHSFASAAAILVFPFSAAILLSQAAATPSSSPIIFTISSRLRALFDAAGLPASSQFFSFLNLKLSQTILSFFTTLPFTLTFLIVAKLSIFHIIAHQRRRRINHHTSSLYLSLLLTHLLNSFIILSANAAVFSLLFLAFNGLEILRLTSDNSTLLLSALGAVLYSVVLTNAMVVCNMAVVVAGMEGLAPGHLPFLRACVLIRGKEATAIALALPVSLGMAGTEALFQHRVVRPYRGSRGMQASVVWEAFSIVYMYSILVVLDVIVSCKLYESCRSSCWERCEEGCDDGLEMETEDKGAMQA